MTPSSSSSTASSDPPLAAPFDSKVDKDGAALAATHKPAAAHGDVAGKHNHTDLREPHVPEEELPILSDLYSFRHSLHAMKKDAHDALTLADVDAKANELTKIMERLHYARRHELEPSRNRVDAVLDTVWLFLFLAWARIASVEDTVYPTYAALASAFRAAEALRAGGAWTAKEVEGVQSRVREVEERIANSTAQAGSDAAASPPPPAGPPRFPADMPTDRRTAWEVAMGRAPVSAVAELPHGQAVLSSLLSRAHRSLALLNAELEVEDDGSLMEEDLRPLREELLDARRRLSAVDAPGNSATDEDGLMELFDRLHTIDAKRDAAGHFAPHPPTSSNSALRRGESFLAGLLYENLDRLHARLVLASGQNAVPAESAYRPAYEQLNALQTELGELQVLNDMYRDPLPLSNAMQSVQQRIAAVEKTVAELAKQERAEAETRAEQGDKDDDTEEKEDSSDPAATLERAIERAARRRQRLLDEADASAARARAGAAIHALLASCRSRIAELVDPCFARVDAPLVATYERLLRVRTLLRRERSRAGFLALDGRRRYRQKRLRDDARAPPIGGVDDVVVTAGAVRLMAATREQVLRDVAAIRKELAEVEDSRIRAMFPSRTTPQDTAARSVSGQNLATTEQSATAASASAAAAAEKASRPDSPGGGVDARSASEFESLDLLHVYGNVSGGGDDAEAQRWRMASGAVSVSAVLDECESIASEVDCYLAETEALSRGEF